MLIRCDGRPGSQDRRCEACKRPMLQVIASMGLRQAEAMQPEQFVCTNAKARLGGLLPCSEAIKAVPLLDVLKRRALG